MISPKLTFSPNRLQVSAFSAQKCISEIRLSLPAESWSYDPVTKTLSVWGPGPMAHAARIVRGFFPKAETRYVAGYGDWVRSVKDRAADHETKVAAKQAAERVKTAEDARRKAEEAAREARQRAERLQEELRRTKEARANESRSWGRSDSGDPSDPYNVLGVRRDADPSVIEAAYKALSKKHHPDRGGDPEMMKKINAAYDRLRAK